MSSKDEPPRYREIDLLGTGGMATVMLAEDTRLRRRVALKRVRAGTDERGLARLRREALVGASLSHRNLVSVYDVRGEGGDLVVVMEYVAGETLAQVIRDDGALPVHRALGILAGLADGLDAIHSRGIVHRDVKPANVLLGSNGAVKLADLGIAAVADRTQTTAGGDVAGTFSYMAPEQLEGRESSPAIDIYALAAVAFETLCGQRARPEQNPIALAHAISTLAPPDLRDVWPQAPPAAAAVLQRGMSYDPASRPASAGALIAGLKEALGPRWDRAEPPRAAGRRRPVGPRYRFPGPLAKSPGESRVSPRPRHPTRCSSAPAMARRTRPQRRRHARVWLPGAGEASGHPTPPARRPRCPVSGRAALAASGAAPLRVNWESPPGVAGASLSPWPVSLDSP